MKILDLIKTIDGKLLNIPKDLNAQISSFKLDSRNVSLNDTFIAINNGYLYIEDAIKAGAICIVTEKNIRINSNVCIIKVEKIEDAILKIISSIRDNYKYIPLIAITGSVGKTTTKELLSHILKEDYHLLNNDGNKNNYIGIMDTLSKLDSSYDLIILELGMNHTGEISALSKAVKPKYAAITNVGTSHIGNLGSIKNILKAKMEITDGLLSSLFVSHKSLKNVKYPNINRCKDIKIKHIKITEHLSFKLKYHKKIYQINFAIPNKEYIYNILLAFEIATYFLFDIQYIVDRINSFKPIKSRMNIININNYKIIDDTYNSSYESLKGAYKYLKRFKRKIVILGDIKELGTYNIKIHKKINRLLKGINKNNILLVGKDTLYIKGKHFKTNEEIISYLKTLNLNNYNILVKGSRLMHMEDIVEFLRK